MKIRRIEMSGFMAGPIALAHYAIDVPAQGLVLITGINGTGKSRLVEAVSWAAWGATLRGTPPHVEGRACEVKIKSDVFEIHRRRSAAGKGSLDWAELSLDPDAAPEYLTKTKSADELERQIGSHEVWRYSHVFSSADAMLFTRAPDRARKQLLETVLGLERFDRALQRCREDLRAVETVVQGQRDLLTRRKEQRANENRRASEAEMNLRLLPPVADLEDLKQRRIGLTKTLQDGATEIAALRASVADLLSDRRDAGADAEQRAHEIQARGQAAAGKARELRGEVRVLERQLAEMKGSPAMCSTCRRPFDKDPEAEQHQAARRADQEKQLRRVQRAAEERELEATQLKKDMTSPLVEAERLRQAAEVENRRLTSEQNDAIADLDEEAAAMRRKITRLSEQISVAVATGQQRLVLEKTIADSSDRIEELGAAVVELEAAVVARTRETALLTSVEQVLGLRGVRAQILGDALASIEAFGNAQLDRLSPDRPLRLKLRSYREKADGKGVTDAISLDVEGAAGGRGYRGASGGERRRLDVAILLAIAEVAQAAAGQEGGTLFFDEALDALDADGVEAVASMLTDLAATRAVFLITHNQDLVQRLRAVLRVTMVAKNVAPAAQPGEIMAPATSQGE